MIYLPKWTHSEFCNKLRGTPLPQWGTSKEWKEWKEKAQKDHPFRLWLVDTAIYSIEKIIRYPGLKIIDLKYKYKTYFTDRKDILTSNGLLKRGEWYDLDTRIEICVFESFKNFMEREMTPFISPDEVRVPKREFFEFLDKFYDNKNHTKLYEIYTWWEQIRDNHYDADNIELNYNLMTIIKLRGLLWT